MFQTSRLILNTVIRIKALPTSGNLAYMKQLHALRSIMQFSCLTDRILKTSVSGHFTYLITQYQLRTDHSIKAVYVHIYLRTLLLTYTRASPVSPVRRDWHKQVREEV